MSYGSQSDSRSWQDEAERAPHQCASSCDEGYSERFSGLYSVESDDGVYGGSDQGEEVRSDLRGGRYLVLHHGAVSGVAWFSEGRKPLSQG